MKTTANLYSQLKLLEFRNKRCIEACTQWLRRKDYAAFQQLRRALRAAAVIFFVSLLTSAAVGASVSLTWDSNSETNIAGYRVFVGTASRVYTRTQDVGNVTAFTVTNLASSGRYFFALTAYNTLGGESDLSSEISGLTPVAPPSGFRIVTNSLQSATSPDGPWRDIANFTVEVPTDNGMAFYRGRLGL